MKLRTKAALIIGVCFLALLGLLLGVAVTVGLARLMRLEEDEAEQDAWRARDSLEVQADSLTATTADWARWDETVEFVQGRAPEFVAANLMDATHVNLRLNVIAFVGPEGSVVYERWFDYSALAATEALPGFAAAIAPGSPLVEHPDTKSHREGLLVLPGAILVVASQPVTGSLGEPPAVGAAVFGRILGNAELADLGHNLHSEVRLSALDDPSLEADELAALAGPPAESAILVLRRDRDRITSLLRLRDVTGEFRAALIVDGPRSIFGVGVTSLRILLGLLAACCLTIGILLFVLLSRKVLSPLWRLSEEVRRIGVSGETARVSVRGGDEVAQLAGSINGMLDAVSRSDAERGKLAAHLIQSQKSEAVGVLAGGIAHDFNNILQVVSSYTEYLLHKAAASDPTIQPLRTIQKAIERGTQLTQKMLVLGRKTAGTLEVVDLNVEIAEVCQLLERAIPKMIRVEHHLAQDLRAVQGDAPGLRQILMNLAVNARDAMPDGGRMVFESRNVQVDEAYRITHPQIGLGEYAMVSVSDTGTGMDSETMKRMYDAFFTTKDVGKGTGLGLAIVFTVVSNHGGYLSCDSELGKGTTFRVYLPVHGRESNHAQKPSDTDAAIPGGAECILVVDDEPDIREAAQKMLEGRGYRVMVAESGERALALSAVTPADLVILDLDMPGRGGYRCLEQLRSLCPGARVLIASGDPAQLSAAETIQIGADAIVNKPFLWEDMLRKVRTMLDRDAAQKPGRW